MLRNSSYKASVSDKQKPDVPKGVPAGPALDPHDGANERRLLIVAGEFD